MLLAREASLADRGYDFPARFDYELRLVERNPVTASSGHDVPAPGGVGGEPLMEAFLLR